MVKNESSNRFWHINTYTFTEINELITILRLIRNILQIIAKNHIWKRLVIRRGLCLACILRIAHIFSMVSLRSDHLIITQLCTFIKPNKQFKTNKRNEKKKITEMKRKSTRVTKFNGHCPSLSSCDCVQSVSKKKDLSSLGTIKIYTHDKKKP